MICLLLFWIFVAWDIVFGGRDVVIFCCSVCSFLALIDRCKHFSTPRDRLTDCVKLYDLCMMVFFLVFYVKYSLGMNEEDERRKQSMTKKRKKESANRFACVGELFLNGYKREAREGELCL